MKRRKTQSGSWQTKDWIEGLDSSDIWYDGDNDLSHDDGYDKEIILIWELENISESTIIILKTWPQAPNQLNVGTTAKLGKVHLGTESQSIARCLHQT